MREATTAYRAEILVRSKKSATSAKRPIYSHLTPSASFESQVRLDVGRVKAQMNKIGVEVVEVRYFALTWQLIRSEKAKEVENG